VDFAFTADEEAFRKEVAAFLEKEVPADYRQKKLTFFDMSAQPDWIAVHRAMAEKLGAKGTARAPLYSAENMVQKIEALYEALLK